jgi:DNA-binding FadR family transcriptional regulator
MNILSFEKTMLSKQISKNLKELVISGNLIPGEQLPNEFELSQRMGVSRSTVREAIRELVAANVLVIVRGKGTFVSQNPGWKKDPLGVEFMDGDSCSLLLMLFETRLLVEPGVAWLAAERADEEDLAAIRDCLETMSAIVEQNQDYSHEDLEFHRSIALATHNPIIQRIVPIVNESIVHGYLETVNVPGSITKALVAHRQIYEAIAAHLPQQAEEGMRRHLEVTVEDIRFRMNYLATTKESDIKS